jgi:hypothetical protein
LYESVLLSEELIQSKPKKTSWWIQFWSPSQVKHKIERNFEWKVKDESFNCLADNGHFRTMLTSQFDYTAASAPSVAPVPCDCLESTNFYSGIVPGDFSISNLNLPRLPIPANADTVNIKAYVVAIISLALVVFAVIIYPLIKRFFPKATCCLRISSKYF